MIFDEVIASAKYQQDKKVIVVASDNLHQGVIGIVASKIVDKCYRPTIIISCQDGLGKGSGRSIPNFHILNALCQCDDLLESYGGHEQAVGLTILEDKIDKFRQRINEYANEVLQEKDLQPSLNVIQIRLKDVSVQLINEIDKLLSPFGIGNPRPVFSTNSLEVLGTPMIVGNNHLKMKIKDVCPRVIDAIGFDMGSKVVEIFNSSNSIDLAYIPQINTWQNTHSIQLNIKDIKIN
jgi:single-stranded-DNA-specific exonuclease